MTTDHLTSTLELVEPSTTLHRAWLASRDEWGVGVHQDGSGLRPEDEVDTPSGFAAWVERLRQEGDASVPLEPGRVRASYWWIVEGGNVLGSITARHRLNDFLLETGGHIGYGIRPSARRRGAATWALTTVLPHARALGLDSVLLTCNVDNVASARTIERCGGVLEDVRDTVLGRKRRYWIGL